MKLFTLFAFLASCALSSACATKGCVDGPGRRPGNDGTTVTNNAQANAYPGGVVYGTAKNVAALRRRGLGGEAQRVVYARAAVAQANEAVLRARDAVHQARGYYDDGEGGLMYERDVYEFGLGY
ncbi:hypothetical protein MMC10_008431 [Thelotrema lepadinum]|nr:hypothetical protein [Thelotrema lepadinum]